MTQALREVHYRTRQSAPGRFPGSHRSRSGESGFEFRTHAALIDAPDARRLDLLASLRDPFGRWQVRLHSQRMSMAVVVVADLSASMDFEGAQRKLATLADLVASLSWSASRAGDSFSFIGCDSALRADVLLPATRVRAAGLELAERLRRLDLDRPSARSAAGLAQASQYLRARRSLVFLVSDFHLDEALLERTLESLAHHEVVPIALWDRAEFEPPVQRRAGHALMPMNDPETGAQRLLWWRPALQQRWQGLQEARRAALETVLGRHHLRPVVLMDGFDADRVTAHFHG